MSSHVILSGTLCAHPCEAVSVGAPNPDQIITVTLLLRRRQHPHEDAIERHLSHEELEALHGADPADMDKVIQFAYLENLRVIDINRAARTVAISGMLGKMADLFGADLQISKIGDSHHRTRQGHLHVPDYLAESVVAVFGFDERPVAATYHQVRPHDSAQPQAYTPRQLAEIYNFPANTGKGQTIAIVELGGGYKDSDLQTYWKDLGLNEVAVSAISVDGSANSPTGDPNGPDGEVMLDIEVAGALAPEAKIAVYFTSNTEKGFLDGINAAIHDKARKPSVISISWGGPEITWAPQTMNAYNAAFHDAALLGITVCVAAGDDGSSDGETDGMNHVDFPASSPWALACGGTRLVAANGKIQSETVWNDGADGGATGGGVSSHFSKPAYQAKVNVPAPKNTRNRDGRGVPDVAAVADPETGYAVIADGQIAVVGGTSAVAPLWAGLIALFNEQLGQNVGWLNSKLYGTIAHDEALHDITVGSNGAFRAGKGWDPCTGLGTPNGKAILSVLQRLFKK